MEYSDSLLGLDQSWGLEQDMSQFTMSFVFSSSAVW